MPDDYPRDAWDPEIVAPNLMEWRDILIDLDLADGQDLEENVAIPHAKSFASVAKKEGMRLGRKYKGVRTGPEIEERNTRQMLEALSLAAHDGDLMMRLVKAHLHFGNRKVPECYLVFNMTPALQCPSLKFPRGHDFRTADPIPNERDESGNHVEGTSNCQAFDEMGNLVCYAIKAEAYAYKDCYPYRVRQRTMWNEAIIHDPAIMVEAVTEIHDRQRDRYPIVAFRWSEAGDVESQFHLDQILKISRELSKLDAPRRITTVLPDDHEIPHTRKRNAKGKFIDGTGKIVRAGDKHFSWPGKFISYLYTARMDLDWSEAKKNKLVVLGSDWRGAGISGQFVMVDDESDPPRQRGEQWGMCPMKCRICQRCPKGLNSKVLNH